MKKEEDTIGRFRISGLIRNNIFLLSLIFLAAILMLRMHVTPARAISFIDQRTIITLAGLLLVTYGIKESGFFDLAATRLTRNIRNERYLALFLVFLSAFLSAFFTNDIALFIVVPLTLGLQKVLKKNYSRIIIFEALAVNAGSALTPIGNPQNIFLWHQWDISFPRFVTAMSPVVLVLLLWLLLFTLVSFPGARISTDGREEEPVNKRLFYLSLFLLTGFIISIEMDAGRWFLPVILLAYLILSRNVLLKADWLLLLLFIFLFIDVGLLIRIPLLHEMLNSLHLHETGRLFLAGVVGSQVISNVPATLVLAHYTDDLRVLAFAVNVGGNGLLIASFANIIALRFIKNKKKFLLFHLYSVPFLLVTALTVWFLFL